MSKRGIDISTYQRNINYLSLKADNIDFAIIRSGFGKNSSQKDNLFEEHYAGLKYVGIPIGVYHYSYVTSVGNAKLEAENCLRFIGDKKIDLPVFYDLEDKTTKKLGKEKITECAIEFCKIIKEAGFIPRGICKFRLVYKLYRCKQINRKRNKNMACSME